MDDPASLLIIVLAFLLGGLVKGVSGMGLPAVTIAILAFAFGLPAAIGLMLVPGILTNVVQVALTGYFRPVFRRIVGFLIASVLAIWIGTGILVAFDDTLLVRALGVVLALYGFINLLGFSIAIQPSVEQWMGPIFGLTNGLVAGMTGVTSTPSVIYLNGLGLTRDQLVQAMGTIFLISYLTLSFSLWLRGLLDVEIGTLSVFAVVPAVCGLWMGQKVRSRISEEAFRKVLYLVLIAVGLYLIVRSLVG